MATKVIKKEVAPASGMKKPSEFKGVADSTNKAVSPMKFSSVGRTNEKFPRFGAIGDTKTTTPQMSIIKDNVNKATSTKATSTPDFVPPTDAEYAGMSTADRKRIKGLTQDIQPDWVTKGRAEEEAKKRKASKTGLY